MTVRVHIHSIPPLGVFYSLNLVFGNVTYLYLNVTFIQILKVRNPFSCIHPNSVHLEPMMICGATTPAMVLIATWSLGLASFDLEMLLNVSIIVAGVIVTYFGQVEFVWIGVIFQIGDIIAEAIRLVMVQRLLSSAKFDMDPFVSTTLLQLMRL